MALYDSYEPESQYKRDPRYGNGNLLMKRTGDLTGLGKGFAVGVPLLARVGGTIAGSVIGMPGLGNVAGALAETGTKAALGAASRDQMHYEDSRDNAESNLAKGFGLASLGNSIGGLSDNFTGMMGRAIPKPPSGVGIAPVPDTTKIKASQDGLFRLNPNVNAGKPVMGLFGGNEKPLTLNAPQPLWSQANLFGR